MDATGQCSNEGVIIMGQISGQPLKNPNGAGSAHPRLKILLADDNPALLRELQRALDKEFEIVSTVSDGRALLEECGREMSMGYCHP